mgnify:CR=1 FL=1
MSGFALSSLVKASLAPSGDHTGSASALGLFVTRVCADPSAVFDRIADFLARRLARSSTVARPLVAKTALAD